MLAMEARPDPPEPPSPAVSTPRVAALVINYNGREVTPGALASLLAMDYPACDVVHVDNGSTDGSREAVAAAFGPEGHPRLREVRIETNRGPAAGAARAMAWALDRGYDYLLILNNDIEVAPDFLTELVRAAESDPAIGMVGPKAFYYWERERIWSTGGSLRFGEAITRERGEGEVDRGQYDADSEVEYVNGCAMLIKREVAEAVGLWDPLYFLCFEDADFCVRARAAGYRCHYAHRAVLYHMVSSSTGGYTPGKTFHSARSTALFVRRHGDYGERLRALLMICLAMPAAWVRELFKGNQAAVVAKIRGYWDGFRAPLTEPPRWYPAETGAEDSGEGRGAGPGPGGDPGTGKKGGDHVRQPA